MRTAAATGPTSPPTFGAPLSKKGGKQPQTDASAEAGVKVLTTEDKLALLTRYQQVTKEFFEKATDEIKMRKEQLEKDLEDAQIKYEESSGRVTRSTMSESKRMIEEQEDNEAIRQSLESAFGSSSKTPKKPHKKHAGEPLSAGLPECGGSGSKPSHAICFK